MPLLIALEELRRQSLEAAQQLGYPPATVLPLSYDYLEPRPLPEIIDRFLCLGGIVAASFGLDRSEARKWFEREGLWLKLTPEERRFILHGSDDLDAFQVRTEALWALGWVLGVVHDLDFGAYNRDHFDADVPDEQSDELTATWRSTVRCRSFDEIAAACDLAYCLHWAIVEARIRKQETPGKVRGYVIWQRRHALEWVLSDEDWDDVPMDT
jgi:hypothetical protein